VGKISSFLSVSVNISTTVADTAKVTINDYVTMTELQLMSTFLRF